MKQTSYYAIYDISDNLVRNRVIRILKDAGFARIQKSAFCGVLTNQQKKDVIESIRNSIASKDSFYMIVTCRQCFGRISVVGKGFDMDYVRGRKAAEVI